MIFFSDKIKLDVRNVFLNFIIRVLDRCTIAPSSFFVTCSHTDPKYTKGDKKVSTPFNLLDSIRNKTVLISYGHPLQAKIKEFMVKGIKPF